MCVPKTSSSTRTLPRSVVLWLIVGALAAQLAINHASATCPKSLAHQRLNELLHSSDDTVRLLYLGNSRVARPIGFAYDGFEDIAFDRGRLAGNGFVVPRKGAGQSADDPHYVFSTGPSMTPSFSWQAEGEVEILHALGLPGLLTRGEAGSANDRHAPDKGRFGRVYLQSVASTIAGGTSEINRGIIATRGLGLPRG